MIKLEHVVLASPEQMEFIIEGMRNPHNSWEKSDSGTGCYITEDDSVVNKEKYSVGSVAARCETCTWCDPLCYGKPERRSYILGPNDHDLMQRLANAGTDHRKFMRMMPVYVRITAPLYWWKQFDCYCVGVVKNSCSTMHKIQEKEFTLEDFSYEQLDMDGRNVLEDTIDVMNESRAYFNKNKAKNIWWQMIQLLPSSYNQTRNVMMNYEVLANIYKSRKNHKLDEWRVHETPEEHKDRVKDFNSGKWGFCDWIESLPYSELITGK